MVDIFEADTQANRIKAEFDEMMKVHAEICDGKPIFCLPCAVKERYETWLRIRNGNMQH